MLLRENHLRGQMWHSLIELMPSQTVYTQSTFTQPTVPIITDPAFVGYEPEGYDWKANFCPPSRYAGITIIWLKH
jgi:hypothetical protein